MDQRGFHASVGDGVPSRAIVLCGGKGGAGSAPSTATSVKVTLAATCSGDPGGNVSYTPLSVLPPKPQTKQAQGNQRQQV